MKEIGLEREFFIVRINNETAGFRRLCLCGKPPSQILENWFDFYSREELVPLVASAEDAGIPYASCDECGYLAEARGEPASNIVGAFFNLKASEFRLAESLQHEFSLVPCDYLKLKPTQLKQFQVKYGKNPSKNQNMYGDIKLTSYSLCGLHIHFSNQIEYKSEGIRQSVSGLMDMPRIIKHLDRYFIDKIREAKRQIGAYEMKSHGFEYRSLPSSVGNNLQLLKNAFDKGF